MPLIFLYGGLGNQIFQLVQGIPDLADTTRRHIIVDASQCFEKKHESANIIVEQFKHRQNIRIYTVRNGFWRVFIKVSQIRFLQYILQKFSIFSDYGQKEKVIQRSMSEGNLISIRSILASTLQVPSEVTAVKNVFHIRLGDFQYAKNYKLLGNINVKFIQKCVDEIPKIFPKHEFYIVSDSPIDAAQILGQTPQFKICLSTTLAEDIFLMMNAENLYVGNSTLAFWCAVCGKASSIFSPKKINMDFDYPNLTNQKRSHIRW